MDAPNVLQMLFTLCFPLLSGPVGKTCLTPEGLGVPALLHLPEDRLDLLKANMSESQVDQDVKREADEAASMADQVVARETRLGSFGTPS